MEKVVGSRKIEMAKWCLRIGFCFIYLYAAIESQLNPDNFLKYIPEMVKNLINPSTFLLTFSVFEIFLASWFLSGIKTKYAGIISFFLMTLIIFPNFVYFSVLFRNVSIAMASLALVFLEE